MRRYGRGDPGLLLAAERSAGEPVRLHASGDGTAVAVEVVRDGDPPATVWSADGIAIGEQPLSPTADEDGCRWPATMTIPTDATWRSGVYLVRFRRAAEPLDADPVTAFFVVRAASTCVVGLSPRARDEHMERVQRLRRTATSTPARPRRRSNDRSRSGCSPNPRHTASDSSTAAARTSTTPTRTASACGTGWPDGPGRSAGSRRGRPRAGIDLDFATNADVEQQPGLLDGYRLYLSVGHDEYWSWAMRDARRALRRWRRQRRVPLRQHVLLAGAHRRQPDGLFQAPIRRGSGVRDRPAAPDDDDVVGSDRRPARSVAHGRHVHARRLPPHRAGACGGAVAATRSTGQTTGCSKEPGSRAAICSARPRRRSATSATAAT